MILVVISIKTDMNNLLLHSSYKTTV